MLQDEQAEEIVARVKAEEKDTKPRPDKSTRRAPETSQLRRMDTLAIEVKSSFKPKSARGNSSADEARANKQYSFKDEHVVFLFKLLHKSNNSTCRSNMSCRGG